MIQPSPNPISFLKRVLRRLGLDPQEKIYYFYMPNLKSSKGSLIAFASVFMVVVAVLIPVAMTLVQNIRANTQQAQLYVAGAQNAAKAGLEDTLGYFVRQNKLLSAYSSQVTEGQTPTWAYAVTIGATPTYVPYSFVDQPFNPFYNTASASYSDTFQSVTQLSGGMTFPFYGLCNEYPLDAATNTLQASATQVASVYFARYEVQEQASTVTNAFNPQAVHDISGERTPNYLNGDGLTWAINSTGYIYERKNYSVDQYGEYLVPYNVSPNKVLATAKAYTEFKKLSCNLPDYEVNTSTAASDAAVYASTAADVILQNECYLGCNCAKGIGFCGMSGGATLPTGAVATNFFGGGVTMAAASNAPISDVSVFGMSLKDIQYIADYQGNLAQNIPMTINEPYKLSFYNGNLTYGPTQASTIYQQLNSTGILCVNGNLTLQAGGPNSGGTSQINPSYYSGIIFATGNVTIGPGCQLDGVCILGYSALYPGQPAPQLVVNGDTIGDYAYMTADPEAVKEVIQQVAQYREDISARKVLLAFPGI